MIDAITGWSDVLPPITDDAGHHPALNSLGRWQLVAGALHQLDLVVEELDEAICDALDNEWETPYARSLARNLVAVLVAGVETLAAPEPQW